MKYYIGADLGTSALKILLTDKCGNIIKSVTNSYNVTYPAPGWSEQHPDLWWGAFEKGIKEITKDIDGGSIEGICVAGQMHGLVILDSDDNILRPAILWNDGRTDKETEYLNTVVGKDKLSEYTANIAFAGFTAPKILWVKNNEPEIFDKISIIILNNFLKNYNQI